VISCTLRLYRL